MKKLMLGLALIIPLAGCTNAEKGAVIGGLGGAALGTAAGGNDTRNALIGGAVGAVAGALVGKAMDANGNPRDGWCRYRDEYGRIYEARCPSNY
ncbi:MAG: glycine zipper 2TM domain-containing protein [Rhizobiaceae bacterium]|nr:glycine zipper 2TM domain-containing protein [Rhizobiaceae bacterium]